MTHFLELTARFAFAAFCAKLASTFLCAGEAPNAAFVCVFALKVLELTYRCESIL